jgi:hypothetical protein
MATTPDRKGLLAREGGGLPSYGTVAKAAAPSPSLVPALPAAMRADSDDDEAGSGAAGVLEASVSAEAMLRLLEGRRKRASHCRSVPASVLMWAAFVACIVTHVPSEQAYDFETALRTDVALATGDGFAVTSAGGWFQWMQSSFLDAVLPQEDYAGNPIPPQDRGRLAQYGLMVAGIRLLQTRSEAAPCGDAATATLYNASCYPVGAVSTAPFGNLTLADELGVGSAFVASTIHGADPDGAAGGVFQYFINVQDDREVTDAAVEGLKQAGWLDAATHAVKVQLAVLNAEVDSFARIEFAAYFTRGGRVETSVVLSSMPVAPYGSGRDWTYLLDALMFLYIAYLLVGTLKRTANILRAPVPLATRLGRLLGFWRILDYGAVGSLVACMATWFEYVKHINAIREGIAASAATPATYAGGPPSLHVELYYAMDLMDTFKVAAVWALIFLSIRLFKYFTFQPRLAVMTNSLARAFSDGAHLALLFTVLLVMYGVWGYFMWGSSAPDWHNVGVAAASTVRLIMYDYDLAVLGTSSFPGMGNLFILSFMVLVTNLVFWMFLGVLLESYTEVRLEAGGAPSLLQEGVAFVQSLPKMAPLETPEWALEGGASCCAARVAACTAWCGGSRGNVSARTSRRWKPGAGTGYTSFGGGGRTSAPARSRREPTWAEITAAVTKGPLSGKHEVTVADLRGALRMRTATAARLVAEVQQAEVDAGAKAAAAAVRNGTTTAAGAGGDEGVHIVGAAPAVGEAGSRSLTLALDDGATSRRITLRLPPVRAPAPYYGSDMPGAEPLPAALQDDLARLERTLSVARGLRTSSRTGRAGGGSKLGVVDDNDHNDDDDDDDGGGGGDDAGPAGAAGIATSRALDHSFASIDELTDHVTRVAIQLAQLRRRDSVQPDGRAGAGSDASSSLLHALSELGGDEAVAAATAASGSSSVANSTPRTAFSPQLRSTPAARRGTPPRVALPAAAGSPANANGDEGSAAASRGSK